MLSPCLCDVENKRHKNMKNTAKKANSKTTKVVNVATNNATKKTATKKVVAPKEVAPVKTDFVVLGNSTYHFVRNWLKDVFKTANIQIKWVKDPEAYTGVIKVNKADLAKAKQVYKDYVKKEQCVEMITF